MNKNTKSFRLRDLSYTKGVNYVIYFLMDNNNLIYGTNKNRDFYIGRIDENLNIRLFKVQNTPNPFITIDSFEGKLDIECKSFGGNYWGIPISHDYAKEKMLSMPCNGNLYNKIVDENIPNINLMIYDAYKLATLKTKNLDKFVEKIKQGFVNIENKKRTQKVRVKVKIKK